MLVGEAVPGTVLALAAAAVLRYGLAAAAVGIAPATGLYGDEVGMSGTETVSGDELKDSDGLDAVAGIPSDAVAWDGLGDVSSS